MTSLHPSLRLALISKAKKQKNFLQKGFTLVELMVVVAIVGVLSAVALPNMLGNRDRAAAQAAIGEANAFAKQCASNMLSENPIELANLPAGIASGLTNGTTGGCGTFAGSVFTPQPAAEFAVVPTNPANLEGIRCGDSISTGAETTCTFTTVGGVVSGLWS